MNHDGCTNCSNQSCVCKEKQCSITVRRSLSSTGCFRERVMKPHHMNPPLDSISQVCYNPKETIAYVKVCVPCQSIQLPAGLAPHGPRCAYRSLLPRLHYETGWILLSKVDQDNFLQGSPQEDYTVKNWPECITLPRTINSSVQCQAGFVPFSTFSCVLSIFRSRQHNPYGLTKEIPLWWASQNQRSAAAISLLLPGWGSQYE